jgi:transcriptional regulator GlxA family with amidase domain
MLLAGEAFSKSFAKNTGKQQFAPLEIKLIAQKCQKIPSRTGLSIEPDYDTNTEFQPDLIICPSLWRNPRPSLRQSPKLISWLHQQWQQGATLVGVGTGVCFIAESGLLDGHPATTHWHYGEQFQRDYPEVNLKPDFFITQSERLYCAASLNALADILVHLISIYWGKNAAQHVERNFSHEVRKPYEEQRYLEGGADRHPDELVAQIQFWMRTNLNSEISLNELAKQFELSQRSFTRRFKQATGINANHYWQQLRIESAQDLLRSSNLSIQEIAYHVGYKDQGHITKLFKKELGITPKEYRKTVRKKLFSQ